MTLIARKINNLNDIVQKFRDIERELTLLGQGDPVGVIKAWPNPNIPAGYLLCNGYTYGTTQYPELFKVFGYRYGGDGSTKFAVPDLRNLLFFGAAKEVTDVNSKIGSYNAGQAAVGTHYPAFNVAWIVRAG